MNTPQTIQIENVGHQDTVTVHLDLNASCDSPAGSYTTTAPTPTAPTTTQKQGFTMKAPQTIHKAIQIENVGHQDTVTVHLDLDVSCDSPAGSYITTAPTTTQK